MVISDFFHLRLGASVGVIKLQLQPQGVYSVCSSIGLLFPQLGPSVCWWRGGGGGGGNRLPV